MSFLNRIVDKVYVINLKKDTKKMNAVKKELDDQHIVYERFDGVLGKEVKNDPRINKTCNDYCADGIKGCALSHRTIWETALKNNYEYIAVFEDDVIFNKNFNTTLQLNYNDIPTDFDIIYLGAMFECGDTSIYNRLNETVQGIHNTRINENILKVNGCGGLYGYIISKKCIQNYIKEKITFHIDIDITKLNKKYNHKAYAFQPVLVEQDVTDSNLNSKFPPILNMALSNIKITNQNHPIPINWLLNENGYQYKNMKQTSLILYVFVLCFLVPIQYYYILFIWLTLEFITSKDIVNTLMYGIMISIPYFIKYNY